ncbi:hypothetical protein HU200_054092 [Digitaria exilis]|uniref:F-box domain-containing protein n=1 Tax=Digitaria exilis TaxID=1010633 RepID=A0A835AW65_9POAL|nr:hypothetical protein HU200_054092 [Digitaria exilis]
MRKPESQPRHEIYPKIATRPTAASQPPSTSPAMAKRLSNLPDKILQRILLFMPSREAATTAALSRRWRGLWPTPARTVILETRSYGRDCTRDAERGARRARIREEPHPKQLVRKKTLTSRHSQSTLDMVFRPEEPSTLLFQTLEQLELDVEYNPTGEASVSALAMLLHCCPVVRDIWLKLSKDLASRIDTRSSIDQVARADFDKSCATLGQDACM